MGKTLMLMGALVLGTAAIASPQTTVPLTIAGNEASASISLPGGLAADLTIRFENAVGLTPSALHVTASVLTPLDVAALSLPGLAQPAVGLPVLLEIDPTPTSALSFEGVVTIELYTHNLSLRSDLPLSLFSSHGGAPFRDITRYESSGSYRAGGSSGGFSRFVIVLDQRNPSNVVDGKFQALDALIGNHAGHMPSLVTAALEAQLDQAWALRQGGDLAGAIQEIAALEDSVAQQSGSAIPDVWRANDASVVNVAGDLRAAAFTLKFSLQRLANAGT